MDDTFFRLLGELIATRPKLKDIFQNSLLGRMHRSGILSQAVISMFEAATPKLNKVELHATLAVAVTELVGDDLDKFIDNLKIAQKEKAKFMGEGGDLPTKETSEEKLNREMRNEMSNAGLGVEPSSEKKPEPTVDNELVSINNQIKALVEGGFTKKGVELETLKLAGLIEAYSGKVAPLVAIKTQLSKFKTEDKKVEVLTKFIKTLK